MSGIGNGMILTFPARHRISSLIEFRVNERYLVWGLKKGSWKWEKKIQVALLYRVRRTNFFVSQIVYFF